MTPVLETRGLLLVRAGLDLPDYSYWLNDQEVVKHSELRHKNHTWEECKQYISSFDGEMDHMWAMFVTGNDRHIGNITFHYDEHNKVGQIGMLIGEKWAWGRKYGREAWGAVLEWAKDAGVRRAEAGCMEINKGIRKVMESSGMAHVCTLGHHFMVDDTPINKVIYGKKLND